MWSRGAKPISPMMTTWLRHTDSMALPTVLSATARQRFDEVNGGEVADSVAGLDGGTA